MEANIDNKISEILGQRNMTQHELARMAGLPDAHLNRIINGYRIPTIVTAMKICRALGLPIEQVFQVAA